PAAGPATSYQYDALGNLYTTTEGGQQTRSLIDPATGSIIGQFTAGAVAAHYTYGAGLVSQVTGAGTSYYDFDLRGSTAALTDGSGANANSYTYLPFGGNLTATGTLANPFQFVGREGVIAVSPALNRMGARFYDPTIGQFTTDDPLRFLGRDINYR